MYKNRKIRATASLTVTFLLSAAFFLLFFCIEMRIGYFNPKVFQSSLHAGNYGIGMEQEMLTKQKELFASYGLPESLTEEIWKENEAYLAFLKYADNEEEQKDGSNFGQQAVLKNYISRQSVYETESVQETIETVVSESAAICARYVYPSFVTGYRQFVQKRNPIFTGIMIGAAVVSIVCILSLFRWYRHRYHAMRYVIGSFFVSLVWNFAGTVAMRCGNMFSVSGVEPSCYKEFLEIYRMRGIYSWYVIDATAAGILILLLITGKRMRNQS